MKGKAYVGGKSVLNTGGNIVDFLVKNYLTNNAALVEIKTPGTRLLGRLYRSGVYNPSDELSGSLMQVLNYRSSLQRDFYPLERGLPSAWSRLTHGALSSSGTPKKSRAMKIRSGA